MKILLICIFVIYLVSTVIGIHKYSKGIENWPEEMQNLYQSYLESGIPEEDINQTFKRSLILSIFVNVSIIGVLFWIILKL